MNELNAVSKSFPINEVSEPEKISDVIYSLMVNPNLSTINYFNDFSELEISPELLVDSEQEEPGLFNVDCNSQRFLMTTHAFHHHLADYPQVATEILISRATRKILCMGAQPVALSAFLYHIDFGDPNGHAIASGAKKGLENAAGKFNLKVTDRKIRFDHFQDHMPVTPTIIISMMGVVKYKDNIATHAFSRKGNNIFVIGRPDNDIAGSEYLEFYHRITNSPLPAFDIKTEVKIQHLLKKLHQQKLVSSASPVGKGGLFFTLLRAGFPNNLGFDITTDAEVRKDAFLFGESMGRILVDVDTEKEDEFVDVLSGLNFPFFMLGHVTRGEIRIDDESFGFIDKMSNII